MSVKSSINSAGAIKRVSERAKKQLLAIGFQIERDAKMLETAVDTGRLRASISVNWTDSGMDRGKTEGYSAGYDAKGNITFSKNRQVEKFKGTSGGDGVGAPMTGGQKFEVVVGTNVDYAPFIEFGTSKMVATPFLRPAFEANRLRLRGMK